MTSFSANCQVFFREKSSSYDVAMIRERREVFSDKKATPLASHKSDGSAFLVEVFSNLFYGSVFALRSLYDDFCLRP